MRGHRIGLRIRGVDKPAQSIGSDIERFRRETIAAFDEAVAQGPNSRFVVMRSVRLPKAFLRELRQHGVQFQKSPGIPLYRRARLGETALEGET